MSKKPVNRNRDVERLQERGFSTELWDAHLRVWGIPYVTPERVVKFGALVCVIDPMHEGGVELADHQVWFAGEYPSNIDGSPILGIRHSSADVQLDEGLTVNHHFSTKPKGPRPYVDNVEKIETYARIISAPAFELDPATAKEPPLPDGGIPPESPFVYPDTASARVGIVMISRKLSELRVAIVGLGGTGSYILDHVAKTRVGEIHLFDADEFQSHNAFRSPGAASAEQVNQRIPKVAYFAELYGQMHKHIQPHSANVDAANVHELAGMDSVFLAMDTGPDKEVIIDFLEKAGIPFFDTGLSVRVVDEALTGIVRITSSSKLVGDVRSRNRITFRPREQDNPYQQNIQISELNALERFPLGLTRWGIPFGASL